MVTEQTVVSTVSSHRHQRQYRFSASRRLEDIGVEESQKENEIVAATHNLPCLSSQPRSIYSRVLGILPCADRHGHSKHSSGGSRVDPLK